MQTGWISGWLAKEISTNSERILGSNGGAPVTAKPLFSSDATRALEISAARHFPPHALMQRAGLALARFALAVAPHARVIWIPCGPGNNGGDGYEAAKHLKRWGKHPVVTSLGSANPPPGDAMAARQGAMEAGVVFADGVPDSYDLCIDALFGIGSLRNFEGQCATWIACINSQKAPVIAVDVPSGLDAETGTGSALRVKADFTLSLLTLKPGLFTAAGRDVCGEIWFNSLDIPEPATACAQLNTALVPAARAHNTHKGNYGDVGIVGGSSGMTGAALLAAQAALHGGAGRIYVGLLDTEHPLLDICQPELMFRTPAALAYESMSIVAGCGGGKAIHAHLPDILDRSSGLVLDADALNAIAADASLQQRLVLRKGKSTVLTPHPLEAARLMGLQSADVQANRLKTAQALADRFGCTVVLKGSGTVIAAPNTLPRINITGNARLATAGTGDVLAGLIGAYLAAGSDSFRAASSAVFRHGQVADSWNTASNLTAQRLAQAL
ncbi:MAG: NAD(P)H-hydrate dehydratase [Rhodoferax sp.]